MQASIGRGVSRTRIILCKIITCVAVSLLIFTCLAVFLCLLGLVMGAKMTARDLAILLLCVLKAAYCTAGYAPIAAVIIYLTDNKALSVFINVVLLLFLPIFLTMLEQSSCSPTSTPPATPWRASPAAVFPTSCSREAAPERSFSAS